MSRLFFFNCVGRRASIEAGLSFSMLAEEGGGVKNG
jgi:hypothetical protein